MNKSQLSAWAVGVIAGGLLMTFAQTASAGEPYIAVTGGASFLQDSTISGERDDIGTERDAVKLDDPTYFVSGAIGYAFDKMWRVEGEVSYQNYDVEQIANNAGVFQAATGDIDLFGVGVNGYYDFRNDTAFTPYLGAGAGAFIGSANDVQRSGRSTLDETAVAPMAQGMLGVSYALADKVDLTVGYRLQWLGVLSGDHTRANGTSVSADVDSVLIHSANVGLRFRF